MKQIWLVAVIALIIKIIAGWGVSYVYQTYYQKNADTWQYDWQAKVINQIAVENPEKYRLFMRSIYEPEILADVYDRCHCIKPRVMFMVKIVSLFYRLTNNNYWVTSALFSVLAFSGLWYAVRSLVPTYPQHQSAIYIGFLFVPSVVCWSAGILKESVLMAAIGYIIGISFSWYNKKTFQLTLLNVFKVLLLLSSVGIVIFLKYYYAATLLPVLIAFFVSVYLWQRYGYSLQRYFWGSWLVLIGLGMCLHPNLYPQHLIEAVYRNQLVILGKAQNQDNILIFYNMSPIWESFLVNAPLALVQGWLMPYVWKATNALQFFIAFETLLLTLLTVVNLFMLLKRKNSFSGKEKEFERLTAVAVLIFSITTLVWLALAVPNAGSLARYKVGYMPFLVSLLLARLLPTLKTSPLLQ